MNLVTQLHSMELAVSSLIIEVTLKLASLTSASMLLLIESDGVRHVSGSQYLIDSYLRQTLTPTVKDLHVSLDLTSKALNECSLQRINPSINSATTCHAPSGCVGSPIRKRPISLVTCDVTESVPKKKRDTLMTEDGYLQDQNIKAVNAAELFANDSEVIDDDSDIEVLDFDNSDCSFTTSVVAGNQLNYTKVEALRSIQNPLTAFQKGSVECRLLSSVFYDFGKELKKKCPQPHDLKNPKTRNFFMTSVTEFMNQFPNLQLNCPNSLISEMKIEVGGSKIRRYTPEAFVRVNARNGFK